MKHQDVVGGGGGCFPGDDCVMISVQHPCIAASHRNRPLCMLSALLYLRNHEGRQLAVQVFVVDTHDNDFEVIDCGCEVD